MIDKQISKTVLDGGLSLETSWFSTALKSSISCCAEGYNHSFPAEFSRRIWAEMSPGSGRGGSLSWGRDLFIYSCSQNVKKGISKGINDAQHECMNICPLPPPPPPPLNDLPRPLPSGGART